jgi:glycosyltransferase involved in cell wall biosynthesis
MRFCMATTFYPPWSFGGDAIQVRRLAHALADRGHEVTVVHSREGYVSMAGGPPDGPEDDHPGVSVVGIDAHAGAASPLATYLTGRPVLAGRQLAAALDGGFDVLHFHNPSLLGGPEALSLGSARVKLYTAHEQWLLCPTHVLWKYQSRVCEKPDCVRCTLTYRRPPQAWRSSSLLDRSVAHLDALICPSRTSERLHERFAGLVRLERLGHFIPDPTVSETSTPEATPYFLYAGRLESIKGVDALLRVFRSRGPEVELRIAGEGTLEEKLRAQAAGLPNVRFLGWQSPERLDTLYRSALAVLVPTAGHESFGLVALEAMARGVPVVARDFGALGELLAESGGGLGFTTDAELDAALTRLAGDAELRALLGGKGRRAYEAHYTEQRHVDAYLGLVEELAAA